MKKQNERYTLSAGSPARDTADFLIALLPIYFWSIFAFGVFNVNSVLAVTISACIVLSLCMQLAVSRHCVPRKLLTAVVTGFTIGFLMPAGAPMWLAVLGAFIATVPFCLPVIGKYLSEYVHPIALAVVILSFFAAMSPQNDLLLLDAASPITPMASLLDGYLPEEGIYDLLLGRHSALMGEVSVLMILIGGVYLYWRKLIRIEAPVSMLLVLAVLSYAFPVVGTRLEFLTAQMFSGGVFFTAVFLMPYYASVPYTRIARILLGCLCGALTYGFRRFMGGFDGVYLALLIACAFTRLIEPLTIDRPINWKSDF